jgi:hypothetical protein
MGTPAQRQVIAVDEEGHGRTAAADRPLTAENSAGDVLAVLDQLQDTAACGHGCVDACLRLVTRNRHVHVAPVAQRNK